MSSFLHTHKKLVILLLVFNCKQFHKNCGLRRIKSTFELHFSLHFNTLNLHPAAVVNMASSSPHNCQSDVAPSSDAPEQKPKVDPKFLAQLQKSEGTTKIVVIFAEGTEKALAEINDKTFPNRGERAQAVHDALVKNAADSQASVTAFLKQQPGVEWESRWINNSMYIKNADYRLVVALAEFPEVGTIREDNIVAHIMEPKPQDSLE